MYAFNTEHNIKQRPILRPEALSPLIEELQEKTIILFVDLLESIGRYDNSHPKMKKQLQRHKTLQDAEKNWMTRKILPDVIIKRLPI